MVGVWNDAWVVPMSPFEYGIVNLQGTILEHFFMPRNDKRKPQLLVVGLNTYNIT